MAEMIDPIANAKVCEATKIPDCRTQKCAITPKAVTPKTQKGVSTLFFFTLKRIFTAQNR